MDGCPKQIEWLKQDREAKRMGGWVGTSARGHFLPTRCLRGRGRGNAAHNLFAQTYRIFVLYLLGVIPLPPIATSV